MALFKKAEITSSYLKAGIMGFAGSGKTYTAASVAIGLHKLTKSDNPMFFLDTETFLKTEWRTDAFVNSNLHLIVCPRRPASRP
jgi:hypothetical protein